MSGPWENYSTSNKEKMPWARYAAEPDVLATEKSTAADLERATRENISLLEAQRRNREPAAMTKTAAPSAISNAVSAVTDNSYVQGAATMVKKAAIPTAMQAGGAYVGGMVGGPPGAIIGESIGGGVGEATNQLLGVNEPSLAEIGLAMAAGPVMRGLVGGLKTVGGAALKAAGGRQVIADIAEGVAKKLFNPAIGSDDLFKQIATKNNVSVPTIRTGNSITSTLNEWAGKPETSIKKEVLDALEPLQGFYQAMPGVASTRGAADLAGDASDYRLLASRAYKAGNYKLGNALSGVRKAIFDDAEAVAVPELREAVKAYRRESAVEELQGILRQANPLKYYKDLQDKNALFRDVFSDREQGQIKNLLNKMATVSPSGFSGVAGRAITTVMGEHAGGITGGIAGFIAPEIAAGVLSTKPGRALMEKLLVGNTWDAPKAAVLAQFWRAQRAEDAQSGNIAAQVASALKDANVPIEDKISQAQMRAAIVAGGRGGMAGQVKAALKSSN